MEKKGTNIDYLLLAAALIFPIYIRILYPTTFHQFDVGTFGEWIAFTNPFHQLYTTDCYCNYPIIGMFLSTGFLKLFNENYFLFLIYLAFFEVLNVLLLYKIFGYFQLKNKGLFCFLFMVIPSTWSGGALWGQIDHIGLSFLLLMCLLLIQVFRKVELAQKIELPISFALGFLFYLSLFTKQLMVFPLIPIGIAFLIICFKTRNVKSGLFTFLNILFGFLMPFIAFEMWLNYSDIYKISHYEHILKNGSDHMDIISGNGITVWMLFYKELEQASTVKIGSIVSPKTLGIVITFIASVLIFFQYIRKALKTSDAIFQISLLSFTLALFNLTFNLFLTGTHERYLFYFYPFLLIAFLGFRTLGIHLKNGDKVLLFLGALCYGLFVLAILNKWLKVGDQHVNTIYHKLIAILHMIIFIRLCVFQHKQLK